MFLPFVLNRYWSTLEGSVVYTFKTELDPKILFQLNAAYKFLASADGLQISHILDEDFNGFRLFRSKQELVYLSGLTQPRLLKVNNLGVTFWARELSTDTGYIYFLPASKKKPIQQIQLDSFSHIRRGQINIIVGRNKTDSEDLIRYVVGQNKIIQASRDDFVVIYNNDTADITIRRGDRWMVRNYTDHHESAPLIELPFLGKTVRVIRIGKRQAYLINDDEESRVFIGDNTYHLGGPLECVWTSPDASTVTLSTVEEHDSERGYQRKLVHLSFDKGQLRIWERKSGFLEIASNGLRWSSDYQCFAVQAKCFSIDYDGKPSQEYRIISCNKVDIHSLPVEPRELCIVSGADPAFILDAPLESIACIGQTELARYPFIWNLRFEYKEKIIAFNALQGAEILNVAIPVYHSGK